ncbi:MAG TPA: Mur ligase domain-containing protein [Solirubrobacterales bacterium]|nr:Mur ligase domain-containing protein [Solirubrobacterales bacterium]
MADRWRGRRLHFIGIGGAGMSGLALVCARLGATVTGSARAASSYMERLRAAGLDPVIGHDAANLPERAEVVVSTAIGEDNPELALARERGVEPLHRSELLAELCAEKRVIAIAGTHGKTTTTAMAVWALRAAGADPAFFVGGEVPGLGPDGEAVNAGWGGGEWVVAEADESDGSFLRLRPEIAVITNVEMDHHTHWGSLATLHAAFAEFADLASTVVLPADGSLDRLAGSTEIVRFDAEAPGPHDLGLAVPGRHNRANARAALAAIAATGIDPELAPAHALADEAVVLDVYPAREQPVGELAGVSGLAVAEAAADRMGGRRVAWTPGAAAAERYLGGRIGAPGEVLVTLGAGDVFRLGEALVDRGSG